MLSDIIESAVSVQPDMELVDRDESEDLQQTLRRCHVDVAIVGSDVSLYEDVFLAKRQVKVLVATGDGRHAEFVEFRHRVLAEPSPQNLLDAIRRALRGDA